MTLIHSKAFVNWRSHVSCPFLNITKDRELPLFRVFGPRGWYFKCPSELNDNQFGIIYQSSIISIKEMILIL